MVDFVQKALGADNTGTNVSSFSATAASGFAGGNGIVGALTWFRSAGASSDIGTISDGTVNFTVSSSIIDYLKNSDNDNLATIFLTGITAGATTITITFSGVITASFCRLEFHEITSPGFVDVHGIQSATSTSSPVSPTVKPNLDQGYSYGASVDTSLPGDTWTAGSGYSLDNHNLTTDTTPVADEHESHVAGGVNISAGFTTNKTADYITAIVVIAPPIVPPARRLRKFMIPVQLRR